MDTQTREPETTAENKAEPRRMLLELVKPEHVAQIAGLPGVFGLLRRGCDYSGGRYEPHGTLEACAGKHPHWAPQLWVVFARGGGEPPVIKAVGVTEFGTYPTGLSVFTLVLVGGESLDLWLGFEERLTQFALANGAHAMQIIGRRGWEKRLKGDWRRQWQLFEQDLAPHPERDAGLAAIAAAKAAGGE